MTENVVPLETAEARKRKRLELMLEGILKEVRAGEIEEFVGVLMYAPDDPVMLCGRRDGERVDLFHAAGVLQHGAQIATVAATTGFEDEDEEG